MKPISLWAAVPFGLVCGTLLGTIVASFYLALALGTGFGQFDMFAVWRAGAGLRLAHPEAFKVAFGTVGFGLLEAERGNCSLKKRRTNNGVNSPWIAIQVRRAIS